MNVDFIEVTNGDKRTIFPKQTVGNNFPNALKLEEGKLYLNVNNNSYKEMITCLRSDYYKPNVSGSNLTQLKTDATKLGYNKMVKLLDDPKNKPNVQAHHHVSPSYDQPLKKKAMTDGSLNDGSLPEGSLPEGSLPNGSLPEGSLPNGSLPEGSLPNGSLPEGSLPDGSLPDGSLNGGSLNGGSLNGGGIMDMIFGTSQPKETMLDGLTVTSDNEEQYSSLDNYDVNQLADGQTKDLLQKVAHDVNKMNFTKESSGLITNNELFQKFVDQKKKELEFTEALTETEQQEGGVRTKYHLLGGH